jgi:hypothetical protein
VLGGDVGVLHLVGLGLGGVERLLGLAGKPYLGGSVDGAEVDQAASRAQRADRMAGPDALQDRAGKPAVLVEQSHRQVLRLDLGVPALLGELLGGGQRLLGFEGEPLQLHGYQRSSGRLGRRGDPVPSKMMEKIL